MAMTYRSVDRDQEFLLPPAMTDWLPADHLVWFLIEAVERMDTSAFHRRARTGGVGRRGYDPDMLLTLFLYAMAHGESSSRQIERLCHTDVAFRVICAQDVPDHTVLARFRQVHQEALTGLLTESLVLSAQLGMVSLGVVAFDGTKIAANASIDANRTEGRLRQLAADFVESVAATDAAEDAVFGAGRRGDELPQQVADRTHRGQRIDQALAQIQAQRQHERVRQEDQAARARECEQAVAEGTWTKGSYPSGVDRVVVARARWEREYARAADRYQAWQSERAAGRRPFGRPPHHPEEHAGVRQAQAAYRAARDAVAGEPGDDPVDLQEAERADSPATEDRDDPPATGSSGQKTKAPRANLTDPDSRLLKARQGWVQGYNCQMAASADEFILSARATQDANDRNQFVPTMNDVTQIAGLLAVRTGRPQMAQIGTMIGDAGYDSQANLAAGGPDRLIPDTRGHQLDRRATEAPAVGDPPEGASPREAMNHRLRTREGHALYKRRAPMIETPNAWIKDGRGLRQFARRGLAAAQAELSFACAITNLLKITSKGITAAQLRTA